MQKNVVVTGGNSGIGLQTAKGLFLDGYNIIIGSRNQQKSLLAVQDIKQSKVNSQNTIQYFPLDLTQKQSVETFTKNVKEQFHHIDILVNNAGVLKDKREVGQNGIQMTYMANHFGHFYLTFLLFDLLSQSKQARIINVSSYGHLQASQSLVKDPECNKGWGSYSVYFKSKLANVMFTTSLADKLSHYPNIKVMSLHPGMVDSDIYRDGCFFKFVKCIGCCCLVSNERGASTSLYLSRAAFLQIQSGQYYDSDSSIGKTHELGKNREQCERLWKMSEELYSINFKI